MEKKVYWEVVDHCYLCDMCYMTKCPYVPPHPWNIDFPHLMLRAKAVKFRKGETRLRDRILSSTDLVGSIAGIPVVSQVVNAVNGSAIGRRMLDKTLGVHPEAPIPDYYSDSGRSRVARGDTPGLEAKPTPETRGRVALFATCYCNRNEPYIDADLAAVFRHNGIPVTVVPQERCCGMPKLELGDLESIEEAKQVNIPALAALVDQGHDIVAPIPSCVLMFKQELPLLYPDDPQVQKVKAAMFDPFEYLMLQAQGRAAAHGLRAPARQGELPRAVPPARAEPRAQDARRAQADSRHRGRGDRALLGAQRNLRSEARVSRHFDEDRSTRVRQGAGGGAGLLLERLPDGGPPDRVRHRGRQAADASADAAAHGIRTLNMNPTASPTGRGKLRPDDLFSLEQYARQRAEFRPKVIAHKRARNVQCGPNAMCVSRTV